MSVKPACTAMSSAVIVTVPADLPVTNPLDDTEAIDVLLENH